MSTSAADPTPAKRLTVDADLAQLGALRSHVTIAARSSGASPDIVEQFELVVSELATNVMQHSDASRVTVTFERVEEGWILDVSDADGLLSLDIPAQADHKRLSGRGLALVHAVMDLVDLVDVDGSQHIRCLKRAG